VGKRRQGQSDRLCLARPWLSGDGSRRCGCPQPEGGRATAIPWERGGRRSEPSPSIEGRSPAWRRRLTVEKDVSAGMLQGTVASTSAGVGESRVSVGGLCHKTLSTHRTHVQELRSIVAQVDRNGRFASRDSLGDDLAGQQITHFGLGRKG